MGPHQDEQIRQSNSLEGRSEHAVTQFLEARLNSSHGLKGSTLERHQVSAISCRALWEHADRVKSLALVFNLNLSVHQGQDDLLAFFLVRSTIDKD
jgi:hypothetical protein